MFAKIGGFLLDSNSFSHNEISETYLVKSRKDGKNYVVKIYDKFFVADSADERIILGKLDHPACPKLIESLETEESVYVIRDYAHGNSLEKLNTPISEYVLLSIGTQLCDVLTYLHTRKPPIIHRDIKPQNVIINGENKIRLIDFGIARQMNDSAPKDTVLVATDGFAAPEQYGFKQTGITADIYSIGMLFCYLLTGSCNILEMESIENRSLVKFVQKCAAFAPDDRYQTAEMVKAALMRACRGNKVRKHTAFAAVLALAVVGGFALGRLSAPVLPPVTEQEQRNDLNHTEDVSFKEPLIEAAVRYALGLDDNESITESALSEVKSLMIEGNYVYPNMEDFHKRGSGQEVGKLVSCSLIKELDDLLKMPLLEELMIIGQNISDIAYISELRNLKRLDIANNFYVYDFSPLKEIDFLEHLFLGNMKITDISVVFDLPFLHEIDLNGGMHYAPAQLKELQKNITTLNIMQCPEAIAYLPENQFVTLAISEGAFDSFSNIDCAKDSLRYIHIDNTTLSNLSGIEEFRNLETVVIQRCPISDFLPLLSLPNLRNLYVDESMREAVEAIESRAEFEISFDY